MGSCLIDPKMYAVADILLLSTNFTLIQSLLTCVVVLNSLAIYHCRSFLHSHLQFKLTMVLRFFQRRALSDALHFGFFYESPGQF
jgi:hypothetical protein